MGRNWICWREKKGGGEEGSAGAGGVDGVELWNWKNKGEGGNQDEIEDRNIPTNSTTIRSIDPIPYFCADVRQFLSFQIT